MVAFGSWNTTTRGWGDYTYATASGTGTECFVSGGSLAQAAEALRRDNQRAELLRKKIDEARNRFSLLADKTIHSRYSDERFQDELRRVCEEFRVVVQSTEVRSDGTFVVHYEHGYKSVHIYSHAHMNNLLTEEAARYFQMSYKQSEDPPEEDDREYGGDFARKIHNIFCERNRQLRHYGLKGLKF